VVRNIIFDWSGTLVDDLPAVWRATNFVFTQAGIPELTLDQFRAEFCLPFADFYTRFMPDVPMGQLEGWFHAHFRQVQDSVVELPHAREFLICCRQRGVRLFVLSTVHADHFAAQIAGNGFDRFLERPYLGVLDKRAKIHQVLEENRLVPGETLLVGDMQHDIETARHGGIFSCGVLTGYNDLIQLRAAQPDLIIEHLGELRQFLEANAWDVTPTTPHLHANHGSQPVVTVGGLIFKDNGQVLMIRTPKWSNLWGIPGGKIKFGESSVDALKREIKEETGLDVEEVTFVLVQDCIRSKEFYREAHFVLLNYTCRCIGESVKLNEEAVEFRWVALTDATSLPINRPTRVLLEAVLERQRQDANG
jgi:phosphoglycolate phosphatase